MKKLIYFFITSVLCQFVYGQTPLDSAQLYTTGAGPDYTVHQGQTVYLSGRGGVSYTWTPSSGLSNPYVANPTFVADSTIQFILFYQTSDSRIVQDTVIINVVYSTCSASCTNWVLGGDMEDPPAGCNLQFGSVDGCWQDGIPFPYSSIDYFNMCAGSGLTVYGAPFNICGYIIPASGGGYGGLGNTIQLNYFEYYQQPLTCTLIKDQVYTGSFKSALSNFSNYSCVPIGLYVSQNRPTNASNNLNMNFAGELIGTAQVSGVVTSLSAWTTVSNTFTANNENWVTIGSFGAIPTCTNSTGTNAAGQYKSQYNYLDDVTITPVPPIISTSLGTNTVCVGMSPTTFDLIETGSPGTSCTWTGSNGFSATGSTVSLTVPSTAATYTYQCSVNLGCYLCSPLTSTISITVLPLTAGPPLTINSISNVVCANSSTGTGTVNVHVTGASGTTTYVWVPSLTTYTNPKHNQGTAVHTPGVYTYSVSTSTCTGIGSATFTINPFPNFTVTTSEPTICYDGINGATLTATGASNYTWTPATGLSSTSGSVVVANPIPTSIYPTNHVYTVNSSNGFSCVNTHTVSVVTAKTPTITITHNGALAYCSGSIHTVTLNGLGVGTGGTYVWSTGQTTPSIIVQPTTTTTYTLTGTTAAGCTGQQVVTVSVTPTPTVTATAASSYICYGTSGTLTAVATPTNSTTTYAWSPYSSNLNPTITPALTATHTFTVSVNTNGCIGKATVTENVNPLPPKPILAGSFCAGETNVLTVTNYTAGENYSWMPPAGGSVSCNNYPICSSETINNPITGGVYSVTATDANGCVSAVTTITPKAAPNVIITPGNFGVDCINNPRTYTLTCTINPGNLATNTYNWSTGATTHSIIVNPSSTTIYSVTGTSGITGCTNTTTVQITLTPNPTLSITASPICTGASATLTASAAPSGTTGFIWLGSGATAGAQYNNPFYTPLINAPKTYTLTGSVNGCPGDPVTITLTPLPRPVLIASASPNTICSGDQSVLSVSGASTYTWSPANSLNTSTGTPVIATPTVTTNYNVQGTDANGCVSSLVFDNVNVIQTPTLNITAPTHTICEGSSVNLTAHGSTNYTWTPDPTLSTTTGSVVTASPSVTTVYTVSATSTSGCNSVGTITITVTPAPSITITAAADPICSGTNTTLTASGATTYTWVSGAGLGINSTNNHSVTITTPNLTSTVTYTLNGTAGTCKGSAILTVTVTLPPTVTFSISTSGNCASTSTICTGDLVTITASSSTAISYTWNPGGLTGDPVTVTPSGVGNNIYTVTASDGSCTSVTTTTVVTANCTAGLSHLPSTGVLTTGNFAAATSFTLTGNLSLSNCNVSISPSVTITVPTGKTLTINNSHLHALSNNMWQGIVVQPGGNINVVSGSLIEDAIVAIDNGGSASAINTGSPAKINVNGSIFNCNRTAIRQAFYQSTTPANYSTSEFSILGSVVTCRCGISQSAGVTPLQVYSGGGTLANPTINDFYSVANYTSSSLKYPYAGLPAFEGVHLENDGVPGNPNPTNFDYTIGGGQLNLFDNLTYGVNAINASFSVAKSAFQVPQLISNGAPLPTNSVGGYGINAVSNINDWYHGMYVNSSQFIGLIRGVQGINYYDMQVSNNTMFSQQIITPVGSISSLVPPSGDYGMYLKSVRFINADMSLNQIANINNCIDFVIDQSSGYNGGNGEYVGPVTANANTISDQFPTTSYTDRFIGNGIVIDNVIVPTNSTTTPPAAGLGTEISVRGNTITGAYRGILVRNQAFQITRTENNNITMQLETTSFSNATTQYGIEHNRVAYSPSNIPAGFPTIYNNSVIGFITSADYGNQLYFEPKKGIWANQTAQQYVTCNTVNACGRAMEFTGSNMKTIWRLNQINSSGEGLVLSSASGGGIIQQQGAVGDGIDNVWSGFSFLNPETYVDALSNASLSPLYIQNLIGYVPIFNNNATGGTPYLAFPSSDLVNSNSPSTTYDCSSTIAGFLSNSHPNNATLNARNANSGQGNYTSNISSSDVTLMEMIAQDSIHYSGDSAQNSFINKNILYRQLKEDTTQMSGSVILQNFYAASQSTCRQLFCLIEDSLYQGGYGYASSLVSGFTPSCTIEQNYKRFYRIYINAMQNNFTAADSADLETLASSCPLLNGSVVFQARAFHNSLYNSFKHYEDNCEQRADGRSAKNQAQLEINKTCSILVYPNPNNGRVYITGFSADEKTTNIEITDVTGKLVYKQQNNIGNGVIELNLTFVSGVYFVRVVNSSGITQIQKIVISN